MNSDWLESFLVFSDLRNFTHAAEQLHISQPALHVKIQKLIEYIGKPLYYKKGREIHLTEEGQMLRRFARESQERSQQFLAELRDTTGRSPVKLAAGEGAFLYILGPAIREMRKNSNCPLSLVNCRGEAIINTLLSGQAHIGVSAIQDLPQSITTTKLTQVEQIAAFSKSHPLAKRKSITIRDLDNIPLILPPKQRPHRETIEQVFRESDLQLNVALEASGWEIMLHFTRLGMGGSIVNSCCHIPSELVTFPIKALPVLTFNILEVSNSWQPESTKVLKSMLKKHANTWKQ